MSKTIERGKLAMSNTPHQVGSIRARKDAMPRRTNPTSAPKTPKEKMTPRPSLPARAVAVAAKSTSA
jgi:hypothetical protein